MRILSGDARGRRIPSPRGKTARPTPTIVRQALFNILGPVDSLSWLELYAGTGSVGLEALSRGAAKVVFVERNSRSARQLDLFLSHMGLKERAMVLESEVTAGVRRLARRGDQFDIIFADPPYDRDLVNKTLILCRDAGVLKEGGILIVQLSSHERVDEALVNTSWRQIDTRRYGDTELRILTLMTGAGTTKDEYRPSLPLGEEP